MGYERSPFGDGTNVTQDVHNHYGPRDTGKTVGAEKTFGAKREAVMDIDGDMLAAGEFSLLAPVLPAGSRILNAYVEVEEAFALGGTSPTILVGTDGSEATNGVVVTQAQAEAVGVYDVSSALAGTWDSATGLAASTTVGLAMGGTSPTSTSAGKARLVVEYYKA